MKEVNFKDLEVGQRLLIKGKFSKTSSGWVSGHGYGSFKSPYKAMDISEKVGIVPKEDRWSTTKREGILIDNIISVDRIDEKGVTFLVRELIGGTVLESGWYSKATKYSPYKLGKWKKLRLDKKDYQSIKEVENLGLDEYTYEDNDTFKRDLLDGDMKRVTRIVDGSGKIHKDNTKLLKLVNLYNGTIDQINIKLK